jgi:hypothetical protein
MNPRVECCGEIPQTEFSQAAEDHEIIHDAYASEPRLRDLPIRPLNLLKLIFLLLIRFYQKTLSRLLPDNTCRFYPSCSHFAYQAIYKYGALRGVPMAIWRLLRCNPFNPGGFDPVP